MGDSFVVLIGAPIYAAFSAVQVGAIVALSRVVYR
jgi:hypothetical protein